MGKMTLAHGFAFWLLLMLALVVLTQPESRPDKLGTISFDTTESAELYFRNVRAYHYILKHEAGDMFDVYRLKALHEEDASADLPFAIYNNWRSNEAFIRLDSSFAGYWQVVLRDSAGHPLEVSLPQMYNESQYAFAVRLYRSLRDEEPLALLSDTGDTLWIDAEARKHINRVLTDYFKLVGRL